VLHQRSPGASTAIPFQNALLWNRVRLLALLAVLLASVSASAAEPPMQPEVQAIYDEAMARYAARDYKAAIHAFEAAYALEPRREILFAQAQATRLAGDCAAALPLYEKFLATSPPPQQVEATRIAVARCEAIAAATPPPRAPDPPPVVITPPPPPPRWYSDRAGAALVGAGVIGVGVGAALISSARATDAEARGVREYDKVAALRDRAERRWAWGVGTIVAGSALVLAGAGRYIWVGLHPTGAVVSAGSRF
jgi:tetratricopeptide (TPR) repeat protein